MVDGNSLINRAYYAVASTLDNGATYGFMTMLLKAVGETEATHLAITFDMRAKTARHKLFPEYKAHRKGMPDDLAAQLADLHELLKVMKIAILEKEGYEADDIIGTVAKTMKELGHCDTIILSADRDCLQLVDNCVELHLTKTGVQNLDIWTKERIVTHYELSPEQLIDLKAIVGDKSDNIPGAFGIGEKGALDLIKQFGTVENVYSNIDSIKPAVATKLHASREKVLISKQLAEIDCNVPIDFDPRSFVFKLPMNREVFEAFKSRRFFSLCNRTNLWDKTVLTTNAKPVVKIINKPQQMAFDFFSPQDSEEKIVEKTEENSDETLNKIIAYVRNEKAYELIHEVELPLVDILAKMNQNGVKIDVVALNEISKKLFTEIDVISTQIYELAGKQFNINSPQQLSKILYEKTGVSLPSTNESVLYKLAKTTPLAAAILRYRRVYKLYSTYVQSYKKLVTDEGFIHSTFESTTSTGRLASHDPNLQNIPQGEDAKEIRALFISRFKGGKVLTADYSQIELRLLAHFSGDETMRTAFINGRDIHMETASKIFGIDALKITPEQRRQAKTVNFGIIYGMSAFALGESLGIKTGDAARFIETYFGGFPSVKSYLDGIRDFAIVNGYVETLLGRRRYIPELSSSNHHTVQFGTRAAMNMPMQGTAADIIKKAMVQIDREIINRSLKSVMIMQIHDELVFDCPADEIETMKELVKEIMQNVVKLSVPLVVDINVTQTL